MKTGTDQSPPAAVNERRDTSLLAGFLTAVALLYTLGYLGIQYLPGNSPYRMGWWGWWDQSLYLKSAIAFSEGNLERSQHWYPLGYALLAAPFAKLAPLHAFFFVNVVSFVALAWLMALMGRQLGIGYVGGAASFVIGTVLSPVLFAQYVVPWTTTPVAALYAAVFSLYLASLNQGLSRPRLSLIAASVVGIAALRPTDVLPTLPVLLHLIWRAVAGARSTRDWGGAISLLAPAVLTATVLTTMYVALHVTIYGVGPSDYMTQAGNVGLDLAIIPARYMLLFSDPRAFYAPGVGILERYPLTVVGIWALLYGLFFVEQLRVITVAVLVSLVFYLSFIDLLPSGIWQYFNIHYWKWTFPFMTLIAFACARQVIEHRRIVRALVAAVAVLPLTAVAMRAEDVVPASIHLADSTHLVLTSRSERPVVAIRLKGLVGNVSDIYFAKHELVLDGQTLRHVEDFRLLPEDGGVSLLLYRPRSASTLELRLAPAVRIDAEIRAVFLEPRFDWRNPFVRRLSQADTLVAWGGVRDVESRECPGAQPRVGMHPASDGEFIRLAYRVLLGREADESGFVAHCDALTSGRVNRRQVVEGFVTSAEFMARER